MTYRSVRLGWADAEKLVAERSRETGLLLSAFREGEFTVRLDAIEEASSAPARRDLTFGKVQEIVGSPVSGVIHNRHPLRREADDAISRWLHQNRARVARADIDRLWPVDTGARGAAPQSPSLARTFSDITPGAKKRWDWEGSIIELACIVHVGGPLEGPVLRQRLVEWFAKTHKGEHPHPKEIAKRVSRFVEALNNTD